MKTGKHGYPIPHPHVPNTKEFIASVLKEMVEQNINHYDPWIETVMIKLKWIADLMNIDTFYVNIFYEDGFWHAVILEWEHLHAHGYPTPDSEYWGGEDRERLMSNVKDTILEYYPSATIKFFKVEPIKE